MRALTTYSALCAIVGNMENATFDGLIARNGASSLTMEGHNSRYC